MAALCAKESATSSPWEPRCFRNICPRLGHKPVAIVARANVSRLAGFPDTSFTNPESLPPLTDAFLMFCDAYPQYADTQQADRIREDEYRHLADHVCLDYSGISLFSQAQLQGSQAPFFDFCYKPASLATQVQHGSAESGTESAMQTRIMRFLNISDDEYNMVCSANSTAAFKLLAETYPFHTNKRLLTVFDHENEAVTTMAETAEKRGAKVMSASFSWPSLRINAAKLKQKLCKRKKNQRGLLVFPLQSAATGTRYPYAWMKLAQENGWHVVLDATALGPKDMDTLGLSLIQPDFMICSFFKLLGKDPSGFATLFVKKSSGTVLENTGAATGVMSVVPVQELVFRGMDHADELGLIRISCRLRCLSNWLVTALAKLQHPNNAQSRPLALVSIYGPRMKNDRGPIIAFNVFDWNGDAVEPRLVQKLADRNGITLGCTNVSPASTAVPVVTVTLGFMTNFEDVYRVWGFIAKFLDADFVEKEKWRYMALNRKMVEV